MPFFAYREEKKMDLIIVVAGGHGKCCLDIAREVYDDIVFLDDGLVEKTINDCKVIGGMKDIQVLREKYSNIFIAIGNNRLREELITQAQEIGFNVVNLISNKSIVSNYAKIGQGCVIFPNVVIEPDSTIGNGCVICANSVINRDAFIADYSFVNSSSVDRPTVLVERK
jgi:hypothetical protein